MSTKQEELLAYLKEGEERIRRQIEDCENRIDQMNHIVNGTLKEIQEEKERKWKENDN